MLDGLYKVKFRAGNDEGGCICLFKDGHVAGGGSVMYYFGTFQQSGNHFTATITAKRHARKSKPSPIMGLNEFHMTMEGLHSGGYAQIIGKIAEVPGLVLLASFTRLDVM